MLLGFVLGPRLEENFRRALTLSRGDLAVFVDSPISATFVGVCVLLVGVQVYFAWRKAGAGARQVAANLAAPDLSAPDFSAPGFSAPGEIVRAGRGAALVEEP